MNGAARSTGGQRQHVLSAWLLKAFARDVAGKPRLTVFDKTTEQFVESDPNSFMIEIDAHSTEIEQAISKLESRAAQAAQILRKRVSRYPAGLYAVMDQEADFIAKGPALTDRGAFRDTRLMVSEHTIRSPATGDRSALARYAGLMYQRAPATEQSMLLWGESIDRGVRAALEQNLPGITVPVQTTVEHRRGRAVELAASIGARLNTSSWFLVRAEPPEAFVLSDSPVVATISFGFDDQWRAILSNETLIVLMPLHPLLCLVFAPQQIMPISRIEPEQLVETINRAMWRAAHRFVVGRSRAELEAAVAEADRLVSVGPLLDTSELERQGAEMAQQIAVEALMRHSVLPHLEMPWHWRNHRLEIGWTVFPAEDREVFFGPAHQTSTPPRTQ